MDNTCFKYEDALQIFDRMKNFHSAELVEKWSHDVILDINEIFAKYNVSSYKLNKNSYMGIVLDCRTIEKDIYIKIVPPMLERYNDEVDTLLKLPKEVTCTIIETIPAKNAIVMEKILPGNLANFKDNKEAYLKLFDILNNNKIVAQEKHMDFKDVVEHDYLILKKYGLSKSLEENLYNKFCEEYIKFGDERNLLHGDIYMNNALVYETGIKIIDPLGFNAPYVFELLPICAYEMFFSGKDYMEIINNFATYFSKYVDKEIYMKAMFCQLVKVYIPSIYEANDGGVRASKWLDIIKTLYPQFILK